MCIYTCKEKRERGIKKKDTRYKIEILMSIYIYIRIYIHIYETILKFYIIKYI